MSYEFTVIDMFAILGGSGGCCFPKGDWRVNNTQRGYCIKNGGIMFYMPDYLPLYNFITKN